MEADTMRMLDGIVRPFGPAGWLALIEPRVRALAVDELGVDPEDLTAQASLADDLAVDSLELTELVVRVEAELGVSVPERVIAQMRTYGDLVTIVVSRVVGAMAAGESAPTPFRAVATTPDGATAVHRAGVLDPYALALLLEDARHRGGRVQITVPARAELPVRAMLEALAGRGIAVTVVAERTRRASAAA